ncbi:hypothetical protein MIR68_005985 [Amoeboaphelidium protococcarum]|nr:hypothetical protein MIR68_005985 [Amoeboaphelidium protococcarum]
MDSAAIVSRLSNKKGVLGVVVLSAVDNAVVENTFQDQDAGLKYAQRYSALCGNASSSVTELNHSDALKFIRVRSNMHEVVVTRDDAFLMIVVQDVTQL